MTADTNRIYVALDDRIVVANGTGDDWTSTDRLVGYDFECVAASREPDRGEGSDGASGDTGPASREPDRAFAGTVESGIQRTTDGGDTWERVAPEIDDRVTSLAVSPHDPDVVWAGTEPSAVYRSGDGGDTWESTPPLSDLPSESEWYFPPRPDTHHVRWLEVDPHDPERLYVAIEAGALVRTDDSGESWRDRPEGARRDNHTLATHPDAEGRVYTAAGDGYAQSEDGGDTWAYPQDGLDHRYVWGLAVPRSDPGTVVVSAASGASSAHTVATAEAYVYRTTGADGDAADGGASDGDATDGDATDSDGPDGHRWELAMDGLPDPNGTVRSVLAAGGGAVLYALNNRGLYRSGDAGGSWERVPVEWPEPYERQTPRALAVV